MRYSPSANDISITLNILTQSTPYIPTSKSGGLTALFGNANALMQTSLRPCVVPGVISMIDAQTSVPPYHTSKLWTDYLYTGIE